MFAAILVLILFLPGAFLPVVLKTSFTSHELIEMGVYVEDADATPVSPKEPANRSHNGSSRLRTSLST